MLASRSARARKAHAARAGRRQARSAEPDRRRQGGCRPRPIRNSPRAPRFRSEPAQAVRAAFPLEPPFASSHALIDAWWLAFGYGAVWATLPNYGGVARLDTATHALAYARTPYGRPFGVAVGGGSAWVATDHGVLRLDSSTGRPTGVALLPAANRSGFASIAYGDGSAWFTNYDRGTLTRVSN